MSDKARVDDVDQKAGAKARSAARPHGTGTTKTLATPAADPATLQRQVLLAVQRDDHSGTTESSQWQTDGGVPAGPVDADAPQTTSSADASDGPPVAGTPDPPAGASPNGSDGGSPNASDGGTPGASDGGSPNSSQPPPDAGPNASSQPPPDAGPNASMPPPDAGPNASMPPPDAGPNASMPPPNSSQVPAGPTGSTGPAGPGGQTGPSRGGQTGPAGNQQGTGQPGGPAGPGGQGQQGNPNEPRAALSGMDLVEHELAEHQAWGAATEQVGTANSSERAEFIAQQVSEGMGSGIASGAAAGLIVTLANSGAARLLARRLPVPVIGSIIGGVIGAAGLVNTFASAENRAQLAQTITRFGEGASGYEIMANSIDSVIAVLDVAANVIDTIGLVCGIIAAACWLAAVPTLGATSPAAATATSIATYCGLASTVISLVKLGLQPLSLLFRSMHTFTSQADPREIQSQGSALSNAAKGLGGTLGGYAGSAAGRGISNAAGRRWPRQPPARPAPAARPSQHPDGVQVRAERPAFDADGPGGAAGTTRRADTADAPGTRPDADAPTTRPEAEAPPMTDAQRRAATRAERQRQRQEQADSVEARRQEDIQARAAEDASTVRQARADTETQIRNRMDAQQSANQQRYDREMARIDASEQTAVNRATANADPDGATYARQSAAQARERALRELQTRNQAAEARAERDFQRVEQRTEAELADIERGAQVQAGDAEYRPDLAFGERDWRTRSFEAGNRGMERRGFFGRGPSRENMDAAMDGAQAGDITAGIFAGSDGPSPAGPGADDRRYTSDNQQTVGVQGENGNFLGIEQTAADRADAFVERVNPNYPPPPRALPEDLEQQRALIAQLRQNASQARGEAAEERANEGETRRRAQQIGEIDRMNAAARTARGAHQTQTTETTAAAEGQRNRNQEAGGSLTDAASRLAGVGTLITMLGAWQGTTAFVGGLLGTVGADSAAASCRQSSRDAGEFIGHLRMVRQTVGQAQAQQPARQAATERDIETARNVESQGRETDSNISSMEQGTQAISSDNEQDMTAASQNARSASTDAERSENNADREQEQHDALAGELAEWAQRHREARRQAVAETSARMESFGYRVIDRSDW